MQYTPISKLVEGESYDQVFLIDTVAPVVTPKKTFVKITVRDLTGTIGGAIWDLKLKTHGSNLAPGKFIKMKVFVTEYNESLSLSIRRTDIQLFNGEPDNITDYVPGLNDAALDTYADEVKKAIEDISDPDIRDLLLNAQSRIDLVNILKESTYGLDGPLSFRGGLLVFVADLIRTTNVVLKSTSRAIDPDFINESIVIAGCILRYTGWSTTCTFLGRLVKPEDSFYMTGIDKAGFRFINHLCINAESDLKITIPEEKKQALENMCDPNNIKTYEGKVVNMIAEIVGLTHNSNFIMSCRHSDNWTAGGRMFIGHNK